MTSIFSVSWISLKPNGPAKMPAIKKPTSGEIFNLKKIKTTGIERPKIISKSVSRLDVIKKITASKYIIIWQYHEFAVLLYISTIYSPLYIASGIFSFCNIY